jgi:hypothetical protein
VNKQKKEVRNAAAEILRQAGLMMLVPAVFALDAVVIGVYKADHVITTDHSITEYLQAILIVSSALAFAAHCRKHPRSVGGMALVVGFFTAMFIRECDGYLDEIRHGIWVYPAVLVSFVAMATSWKHRDTFIPSMSELARSRGFAPISLGLLLIHIFSRLFGNSDLWKVTLGDLYNTIIRDAVQEGIELLGYVYVAYGTAWFILEQRRTREAAHRVGMVGQNPAP